ncbi:hypothetical protein [Streptomyces uncialis]|uniref:Uncharacterized protein n=1 Tax=Streptomyces uncialis TaxID=1048205 RepID=A0A1Q4V137_9ACTN|nr:hypothetical protein [Streptomyces uncialis]OKH91459.1 hypothetical protein AB852_28250 [Streptomyces uncialis]
MTPFEVIDLSASACLTLGAVAKAAADDALHLPPLPAVVRAAPAALVACAAHAATAAIDAATTQWHLLLLHHDQMKGSAR